MKSISVDNGNVYLSNELNLNLSINFISSIIAHLKAFSLSIERKINFER